MRKFVSRPISPTGEGFITPATGGEPPVPLSFIFNGRTFEISAIVRSWRSSKRDRGDNYLKRHWFELETKDGATIEVYYDRETRRGASAWWLYTITE